MTQKCLHRERLEMLLHRGFVNSEMFTDVNCSVCNGYSDSNGCMHYTDREHLEFFKQLRYSEVKQ